MKSLIVQLQPDLAPGLDVAEAKSAIEAISRSALVVSYVFSEGIDNGPYLNFTFSTFNLKELWLLLSQAIYTRSSLGKSLKKSSIAVCEGSRSWDNYLLLHHYDSSITIDNPNKL